MKKITLVLVLSFVTLISSATNVVKNSGFEDSPATFTVEENGLNVVRRVANHQDAKAQTGSPTSTAIDIVDGMWVRKSPNSGFIKGVVRTDLTHPKGLVEGNSVLNLRHNQNNTATGLTNWYQNVLQQKVENGLDLEQKYVLTFDAKIDNETSPTLTNVCTQIVAVVRDIVNNLQTTQTIVLTEGTTWNNYKATFNLPAWVAGGGAGASGSKVIIGLGISTEYGLNDDPTKTKYSSVLIDNVVLQTEADYLLTTGLNEISNKTFCVGSIQKINFINTPLSSSISIYNLAGSKVSQFISDKSEFSISLPSGIYLVKVDNNVQKVIIK
jgi:hypothetical protein